MFAIGGVCIADPGFDSGKRGGNDDVEEELDIEKVEDGFTIGDV